MDDAAMHAAVAIIERVDVNEAKCGGSGFEHRVQIVLAHAGVRFQQAGYEFVQIARTRPDKLGQRDAGVIPGTEKNAVGA